MGWIELHLLISRYLHDKDAPQILMYWSLEKEKKAAQM